MSRNKVSAYGVVGGRIPPAVERPYFGCKVDVEKEVLRELEVL